MPPTALKVGDFISPSILSGGSYKVTALFKYSSGVMHGAIDIGCPIGTNLYAPFSGTIVSSRDGVPNNKPGDKIWSGKPSNWILLKCKIMTTTGTTQNATIFLQHLSPGLSVKTGQRVTKGQLLAKTGNSGNSSGPHLHAGAQWVRASRGHGAHTRYDHIYNSDLRIWGPERYIGLEDDVSVEYHYGGKPSGKQTIKTSYTDLEKSRWNPAKKGLEHAMVYINVQNAKFAAGKQVGLLRIRSVRTNTNDKSAYHDYPIIAGVGSQLITHTYFESGDGGPTKYQVKCHGGLTEVTLDTRYRKGAVVY